MEMKHVRQIQRCCANCESVLLIRIRQYWPSTLRIPYVFLTSTALHRMRVSCFLEPGVGWHRAAVLPGGPRAEHTAVAYQGSPWIAGRVRPAGGIHIEGALRDVAVLGVASGGEVACPARLGVLVPPRGVAGEAQRRARFAPCSFCGRVTFTDDEGGEPAFMSTRPGAAPSCCGHCHCSSGRAHTAPSAANFTAPTRRRDSRQTRGSVARSTSACRTAPTFLGVGIYERR